MSSSMPRPRALFRRACPKLGRQLRDQRAQRDPAIFLHLGEMVAVDDRERADSAADPGISRSCLDGFRAAPVDVEQRRDHLEIVLHAVVDFADEAPLPFQRLRHLVLGFVDSRDGAGEGVAKLLNLLRGAELARQVERGLPGPIAARPHAPGVSAGAPRGD